MLALLALQLAGHAMPSSPTAQDTPWQIIPTVTRVDATGRSLTLLRRRRPVTIHRTLLPAHPGMKNPNAAFVGCVASFTQSSQGWTAEVSQCKEAFRDAAQAAVDGWEVDAPAGLRDASFAVTIVFTNQESHESVYVAVDSQHISTDSNPWFVARDYPTQPRRGKVHYPKRATSLMLPEQACSVEMTVDTRGRPSDLSVWGCHEALRASLTDELAGWRYDPFIVDGQPTPVPKSMRIRFKPRG